MKAILNLLKGLAVIYWVLAASLFTSMLFFPQAIDVLHETYNNAFAGSPSSEVVSSSEEIPSSVEEILSSSLEEIISSEELVSSSEEIVSSSEGATTSSEDIPSSLPESQPLRQADVCTRQCIDDPATEENECLSACDFELTWVGYDISTEIPAEPVHGDMYIVIDENDDLFHSVFVFVVSTDLNENGEEIIVSEWVEVIVPIGQTEGYDFYYDPQLGQIFILELIETGGIDPLPEEEFVAGLEEILIYSAIFMLPFTILVFSLGSKLNESSSEIDPNPEVIIENRQSKKHAVRTRAIGVTRLRVRK